MRKARQRVRWACAARRDSPESSGLEGALPAAVAVEAELDIVKEKKSAEA